MIGNGLSCVCLSHGGGQEEGGQVEQAAQQGCAASRGRCHSDPSTPSNHGQGELGLEAYLWYLVIFFPGYVMFGQKIKFNSDQCGSDYQRLSVIM